MNSTRFQRYFAVYEAQQRLIYRYFRNMSTRAIALAMFFVKVDWAKEVTTFFFSFEGF